VATEINLSLYTYQNGTFDVMVVDKATGEELRFSGEKKLTDQELEMVNRIAPACVWTGYVRTTPED
jgi:hypothetical protein